MMLLQETSLQVHQILPQLVVNRLMSNEEPVVDSSEEVKDIIPGKPYHWRDWNIVRSRDCLYLWSDMTAIELSNGSNGWFRFILDGKLATMYSSGSPEGTTDSTENRGEFLEKLLRAKSQVKAGTTSQSLFPGSSIQGKLMVGNWAISCRKEGELVINNSDGAPNSQPCSRKTSMDSS